MKASFLRRESLQLVILALPFVLAAVLWDKLPGRIVTHWDLHHRPDGWMPKAEGLLVPPTINILVTLFLAVLPRFVPRLRRDGFVSSHLNLRRVWRLARLALSAFVTMICVVAAGAAAGWRLDVGWVCVMGGLVLLTVVGNFCANLEPNYFMGIRTPWTLEDPATWRATHRLGSRVMVFGSLALLAAGLIVPPFILTGLFVGFIVLLALGSLGFSAWFYQKHTAR